MAGVRLLLWIGLCLGITLGGARSVRAEKLALADIHGESDVADEAGAVTLLVRTALAGSDRTLLGAPPGFRVADPSTLNKIGADHAVAMELAREGTGLRVTIVIVAARSADAKPDEPPLDPDVSYVRAGDGDLQALAQGITKHITSKLSLEQMKTFPAGSLGRLRPFAAAIRLAPTDPAAAAQSLADIVTRTTLAPAQAMLKGLPDRATPATLSVLAARGIDDLEKLDAIAAGTDATAAAARAFAAISRGEISAADKALAGVAGAAGAAGKDGLVALGRLIVAESRTDDKVLADRLKEAFASDHQRAALAFASTITPIRLSPAIHQAMLALAEKQAESSPGVATRVGLAAAERGVEPLRSLGLVSVRELDDADLDRLTPFLAPGAKDENHPTVLRLRAELAMRKGDGTDAVAIAAFLKAAEKDPRAQRYHGWFLMAEGRHADAAAAFAKAGAKRERSRALLAANDLASAHAALERAGARSPEDLVIEGRWALLEKQFALAEEKIALAELGAPANPVVHVAILDLSTHKPDAKRSKISRLVVEKGTSVKGELPPEPAAPPPPGSGSGSSAGGPKPPSDESPINPLKEDSRALAHLVQSLKDLARLENAKIVLVEQRWEPSVFSIRRVDPTVLRDAIAKILQAPPYKLRTTFSRNVFEDGKIDAARVMGALGDADAVLVYRAEPAGGDAIDVGLLLHVKGASVASKVDSEVEMPAAVGLATAKLVFAGIVAGLVLATLIFLLTRPMGRVKVVIEKSGDLADEVLCILISKTPDRPAIDDDAKFHGATKQAGAITKQRHATLVPATPKGHEFRIPAGKWYVHLYGVYVRGAQFRRVPETFTQEVELRRNDTKTVEFDLSSKLAEVRVVIESEPRAGHSVWANNDIAKKVTTDAAGEAVLLLPIGGHTITVEAQGHRIKKQIHLASIKIERLPFNVARELRIAGDADLAYGDAPHSVSQPLPASNELPLDDNPSGVKIRSSPAHKQVSNVAADQTLPLADSRPVVAPPRSEMKPGDVLLGRYRVVAELGRGAMGVVRRAWDEKLEREVAIKEMADELKKNAEAMRLFTQEAKALAQLNHTNIVAMYDQITEGDRIFMIMEFVDGRPLEQLLEAREKFPWHEAVGIVDQLLTGLAYAHARKVIHRDIKPANIFVASDGIVKIGDFGLARVLREVTIRKTEIRGTPLYMAPEQITGTNVDHRADLYAVGCTLFELVTGRPPHIEGDILYAQLHSKPPDASTLVGGLPPQLDVIIGKLIAKRAEERYASANDARAALKKLG